LIRRKVNEALAAFEAATHELETTSAERFAALTAEGEAFRERLDQDEIAALAAIRARADHLATELDQHRVATMAAEAEALDALQLRFDTLREESGRLGEQIAAAESDALKAWYERSAAHADTTLQSLGAVSRDHEAVVAQAMERLAGFGIPPARWFPGSRRKPGGWTTNWHAGARAPRLPLRNSAPR
jgi:hypothetical protein